MQIPYNHNQSGTSTKTHLNSQKLPQQKLNKGKLLSPGQRWKVALTYVGESSKLIFVSLIATSEMAQ